jgi:two-component system, chemotaxis family, CheB/CheR fusion protein
MTQGPEHIGNQDGLPPAEPPPDGLKRFPVVGVGASAGGLEALEVMLQRFTIDSMAFVVVQHLAPAQQSRLAELLGRWTRMTVVTVTDGMRVEPNHV